MACEDIDGKACALSIQNRLSDPSNLGLSQSPAYYFEQRLRMRERPPLASLSVPDPSAVEEDLEALMSQRIEELKEIVLRKRRLRLLVQELANEGWRQSDAKRAMRDSLIAEENQQMTQRYERLLGIKQQVATTETAIAQFSAALEGEEALCIERTRQLHSKESGYLELVGQLGQVESSHSALCTRLQWHEEKVRDLQTISEAYYQTTEELHKKSLADHILVKELNNELQELKGNIRVFCRIRPLLAEDQSTLANIQVAGNRIRLTTARGQHIFQFDRVFEQSASQERVFEDISQLVRSALDGYKVSIFAYGQTGSGKTYTMEGPPDSSSEESKGVIQRSVEQIFAVSQDLKRFGWRFVLWASFVEVYNEQIRDLLEGSKVMTAFSANLLEPTVVEVREPATLYELLARAKQQRAVAQMLYNNHSSRSHSLFQLKIAGQNDLTQKQTDGVLNLIDLAGSEKWDDKQEDESRRQETIAINKSLTCLGDVIHAMVKKSSHVPFRNSKLTTILQNCLGADSKTLMFLNISPAESRTAETYNSLKFGSKVAKCNLKQQRYGTK